MKRCIIWVAALCLLIFWPVKGTDIGRLRPVGAVTIYMNNDSVQIRTDTDDAGIGRDLGEAIFDLHRTAPGALFLDTAEYIVVQGEAERILPQLMYYFRPAARICTTETPVSAKAAAVFLPAHDPEVTLLSALTGRKTVPALEINEGAG